MSLDRIVTPLQRVQLFESLRAEQIEEIAQRAEKLRFRAGDVITQRGDVADGAFLIVSGQAERLEEDAAGDRETIAEGSLIGEMGMLIDHQHSSTVVARDRVLCLKINRTSLTAQMLEDPTVADGLHEQMSRRLMRTADELRKIDASLSGAWAERFPPRASTHPYPASH